MKLEKFSLKSRHHPCAHKIQNAFLFHGLEPDVSLPIQGIIIIMDSNEKCTLF